jgi:hypothetical protein
LWSLCIDVYSCNIFGRISSFERHQIIEAKKTKRESWLVVGSAVFEVSIFISEIISF